MKKINLICALITLAALNSCTKEIVKSTTQNEEVVVDSYLAVSNGEERLTYIDDYLPILIDNEWNNIVPPTDFVPKYLGCVVHMWEKNGNIDVYYQFSSLEELEDFLPTETNGCTMKVSSRINPADGKPIAFCGGRGNECTVQTRNQGTETRDFCCAY